MPQHWRNSQVPYFITVKDHNTINHGSTTPTTTSSTDSNGTHAHSSSLKIGTRVSYPQVKFLFQDDPPLTDALEDEDIVLELDTTGSQIINSSVGNGEVFQITGDVEITTNGTENNIKSVDINRVPSQIEGMEDLLKNITINRSSDGDVDDDLEQLQNLVHIFNQRNQLLLGCVKSV
ncbi:hypothetical protein WICPIJ_009257 [Wickerhamomyces pijperi]|uniref:Uncharacterized protein n=1 Tax=Wickerhamomyces pijperi TaxID=599730 RepID=A0A9P8PQR6_WICPI|nr:hypothetical protein WICPIJ_009257 [Wickerhamomyces pijperi]